MATNQSLAPPRIRLQYDSMRESNPEPTIFSPKIEEHLGLVRSVVYKYLKMARLEDSDLYSVGCLALVEAARSFDSSKAKFTTWATRLIRQRVVDELRRSGKIKADGVSEVACYRNGRRYEVQFATVSSIISDDPADSSEYASFKRLVREYYILGKSLSEIATPIGISKETVRKRIRLAISAIRRKNYQALENTP